MKTLYWIIVAIIFASIGFCVNNISIMDALIISVSAIIYFLPTIILWYKWRDMEDTPFGLFFLFNAASGWMIFTWFIYLYVALFDKDIK